MKKNQFLIVYVGFVVSMMIMGYNQFGVNKESIGLSFALDEIEALAKGENSSHEETKENQPISNRPFSLDDDIVDWLEQVGLIW